MVLDSYVSFDETDFKIFRSFREISQDPGSMTLAVFKNVDQKISPSFTKNRLTHRGSDSISGGY